MSADPVTNGHVAATEVPEVLAWDRLERGWTDADRARSQEIVSSSDDAIVSVNSQGVLDSWNPAAERMFGHTADQALARRAEILFPPDVADKERETVARVLAGETIRLHETVRVRRDGTLVEVSLTASPLRDSNGAVVGALAIFRDSSERNVRERRLREAQARFKGAFENAPIGMAVAAIDGRYLEVNRVLCELTGRSEEELLALDVLSVTTEEDRHADEECVHRLLAGQARSCEFEKRYLHPDGSHLWVQVSVSLVTDASGEPIHFVRQMQDISARKSAEEELEAHRQHLTSLTRSNGAPAREPKKRSGPGQGDALADPRAAEIERMLELARIQLGMEIAYLAEFENGQQVFRAIAGDPSSFGVQEGTGIPLESTYCRRMVDGRLERAVCNARANAKTRALPVTAEADIGSYAGVPLRFSDGRLYGTLCCLSHGPRPELTGRDIALLDFLAGVIVDRLERQELESRERRDAIEFAGIQALVSALEVRDHYTGEHSLSVVRLAGDVACQLGLAAAEIREVEQVAILHDIGKVGIPDSILQKRGKLSEVEWELMRQHPAVGAQIVASTESLCHLAPAVRAEHERWDGNGYPNGLRGTEIPIASRVTFVCDAYHAMTSDRPYRAAMSPGDALRELEANAGSQFDPDVVVALGVLDRVASRGRTSAQLPDIQGPMPAAETDRAWLSPREREIFGLLGEGFRGEEIATRLILSSDTVRTHIRNGMRRLGARTRVQAVALALASGEVTLRGGVPSRRKALVEPRPL